MMPVEGVILSVIIGTLAAIVYSLRVLVLMERRVARIEIHIENLASKILTEEARIEKQEKTIAGQLTKKKKKKRKK